jgi:hypothetical protein
MGHTTYRAFRRSVFGTVVADRPSPACYARPAQRLRLPALFAATSQLGDVPWKSLTGFKNAAIHQYDAIDLDAVWEIVRVDLPRIRRKVRSLLKDLPEG